MQTVAAEVAATVVVGEVLSEWSVGMMVWWARWAEQYLALM